jgi:hypothetical protein
MPSSAFINAIRDAGTKDDALSALQQAWDERCAAKDKVKELESLCDDLENRLSEMQAEIMLLTHRSVSATERGRRQCPRSDTGALGGAARDVVYNRLAASYNEGLDEAVAVTKSFKLAADPNCVADAILDLKVIEVRHEINGPIVYHRVGSAR